MTDSNESMTPRIDTSDAAQVARWTREFGVTDDQLSEAVVKVGAKPADVELYLNGSRSSTNADIANDAAKASSATGK